MDGYFSIGEKIFLFNIQIYHFIDDTFVINFLCLIA